MKHDFNVSNPMFQAHRRHKQRKLKQGLLEGGSSSEKRREDTKNPADEERRFHIMREVEIMFRCRFALVMCEVHSPGPSTVRANRDFFHEF